MPIFALVDCNNFYCSCQRAFDPSLTKRPVIVLSNNDGCAIARSNESKALGIEMGAPWHQIKDFCAKHDVAVFSSNYALYGDMSRRVMDCLATFTPDLEVYSIDESFLRLDGFQHLDLIAYATEIRSTVLQRTGIPVSIGLGPTKVLAKVANRVAKKRTTTGVFDLRDRAIQDEILPTIETEDVWGIGSRWAARLEKLGIKTAADLRAAEPRLIRQQLNVQGERIVRELRGELCFDLEQPQPKKAIVSSRSFGCLVTELTELQEAISTYTARAAEKLRRQSSRTARMQVFLQTNRFRPNEPQYSPSVSYSFPMPTSSSPVMIGAARRCIAAIYRPGFRYQKCGVMLIDILPDSLSQQNLFAEDTCDQQDKLMQLVDGINRQMGRGSLFFGAQGTQQLWGLRCQHRSPRYTTRWAELMQVRC